MIKIDDFIDYKCFSNLTFHPSGDYAVAKVHQGQLIDNTYHHDLIKVCLSGAYEYLTDRHDIDDFLFSDDELIYSVKKDGQTLYYKLDGQVVLSFDEGVKDLCFLDQDQVLYITSLEDKSDKLEGNYEVFEEIPFWSNGGSFGHGMQILKLYNLKTHQSEIISKPGQYVEAFTYDKASESVLIRYMPFHGVLATRNDLLIYDFKCKTHSKLDKPEGFIYSYADRMDSYTLMVAGSDCRTYGENENHKIYKVDLRMGTWKLLTPDLDFSLWNTVVSDCRHGGLDTFKSSDQALYFITTEGGSSYLNKVDLKGHHTRFESPEGSIDAYAIGPNIMTVAMHDYGLQEFYLHEGGHYKKLTSINDPFEISKPEKVSFEYSKDLTIDGWLLKPTSYEPGKKYPGILSIHGGPKSAFGQVYNHENHFLASQGYMVFYCNPRGSNGKDDEFSDIRGKFGTIDYEDLCHFTDKVLETYPSIDEKRLAVMGGSYGGFMTNWIVGKSDRFKAAVSQRCISNWVTMYGVSDIGYHWTEYQNGATPFDDYEKLWHHSPMKYADKIKTPILFIHSEKDYRCHYVESMQMFTSVKKNGVDTRFCLIKDENHDLSRSGKPKERIVRLTEISNWLNKYLK